MPLKPDSNAGTLTRFGSGQLIEPCRYRCIRVKANTGGDGSVRHKVAGKMRKWMKERRADSER